MGYQDGMGLRPGRTKDKLSADRGNTNSTFSAAAGYRAAGAVSPVREAPKSDAMATGGGGGVFVVPVQHGVPCVWWARPSGGVQKIKRKNRTAVGRRCSVATACRPMPGGRGVLTGRIRNPGRQWRRT